MFLAEYMPWGLLAPLSPIALLVYTKTCPCRKHPLPKLLPLPVLILLAAAHGVWLCLFEFLHSLRSRRQDLLVAPRVPPLSHGRLKPPPWLLPLVSSLPLLWPAFTTWNQNGLKPTLLFLSLLQCLPLCLR